MQYDSRIRQKRVRRKKAYAYKEEKEELLSMDEDPMCDLRRYASLCPMSMYVAKLMPTEEKGKDMYVKVERTQLIVCCYVEQIVGCPARNACGLVESTSSCSESDTWRWSRRTRGRALQLVQEERAQGGRPLPL